MNSGCRALNRLFKPINNRNLKPNRTLTTFNLVPVNAMLLEKLHAGIVGYWKVYSRYQIEVVNSIALALNSLIKSINNRSLKEKYRSKRT